MSTKTTQAPTNRKFHFSKNDFSKKELLIFALAFALIGGLIVWKIFAAGPLVVKINFQPTGSAVPAGYVADTGQTYADRGNGYSYGWSSDNTIFARDRNVNSDQRYDTLNHMQKAGSAKIWEIAVPNGSYNVRLVAGDASFYDGVFKINLEGKLFLDAVPTSSTKWIERTGVVNVTDGKLTISNAAGAINNKINFIEITGVSTDSQYLSDMSSSQVVNGWGPIEKDRSNGENSAGDGRTITLNGKTYTKGLGVHGYSETTYVLGSQFTSFTTEVGIDDEVGSKGSVIFQIVLDGTKVYDSGLVTGSTATKSVNINVAGKNSLKLVVDSGGDGASYDHADWADAKLLKTTATAGGLPIVSITANPSNITPGGSTVLSWVSSNATSCTSSGAWSGAKAINGSFTTTALSATSTFSITCTGTGGSSSASTIVTVAVAPPPPPPSTSSSVIRPAPPRQGYTIPSTAISVTNPSSLSSALAGSNQNIVLENGTYSYPSAITLSGKRLYARNVGQAIINTGVDLGRATNAGHLYGVKVNIPSASHLSPNSGAVTTWSSGAVLQDVEINGNNFPYFGLSGYNPDGLVVERVIVRNVLSDGLRMSTNSDNGAVIKRIWDVYVDTARGADIYPGTGGSGIWIGHQVTDGAKRLEVHRAEWMGVWTGNGAKNTIIEDVTVADIGPRGSIGIYAEHGTTFVTFRKLDINVTGTGVNVEWWYGGDGSSNLIIEDFTIVGGVGSPFAGVFMDAGTFASTVRRGKITMNSSGDGVGYPTGNLCGSPGNTIETSTITYQGTGIISRGHSRATGGC